MSGGCFYPRESRVNILITRVLIHSGKRIAVIPFSAALWHAILRNACVIDIS